MTILWTARFESAFKSLERSTQKKVLKALLLLDSDLHHPSLQVKQIQGTAGIYEARVDRRYRMTFELQDDKRIMRNVDNHDACLRDP